MSRPGFIEGVGVALLGSLMVGAAWTLLTPLLPFALVTRLLVTGVAGGYLLYLLARGGLRIGRVSATAVWGVMSLLLMLVDPPLLVYVLAHATALWLVRIFAFGHGALTALADLALVGLGLLAAAWAMLQTGSAGLAAWCLLLVQAAFSCMPGVASQRPRETHAGQTEDPFERAHRAAQGALVRLASHR